MSKILNTLRKSIKKHGRTYFAYTAYALFTGFAIFFSPYTKTIAGWILWVNLAIEQIMGSILSGSTLSFHVNFILALALTPILIVAIPAGIYRFIKRDMPPYLIQSIWMLWIVTAVSRLLSQ